MYIASTVPEFDTEWKEFFSLYPEVATLSWQERNVFKAFAKRICDHMQFDAIIQKALDKAWDDGYDEGISDNKTDMKYDIEKIINGKINECPEQENLLSDIQAEINGL